MSDDLVRYALAAEPPETALPQAEVYRELVRQNLFAVCHNAFPVARDVLGDDGFQGLFSDFLEAGGPTTSLYRDIPGDLVDWALDAAVEMADLLHYEWLELVAARHPANLTEWSGETVGLVAVNPTMQVGVYDRHVHTISADTPAPPRLNHLTAYLVWRRSDDEVCFQRVGLTVARAVALAHDAPRSPDNLAQALQDGEGSDTTELAASLGAVFAELAARDGLRL